MTENLVDLIARRTGHALTAGEQRFSYEDLMALAGGLAARLREHGLRPGDTVSLVLPNSPAFVIAYFACWHAGLVANPLNTRQSLDEHISVLRHARSRLVLTGPTFEAAARKCAGELDVPTLTIDEARPDALTVSPSAKPERGGAAPAVLIYTSGTTSAPKGVLLSHANLLADARGIAERLGIGPDYRTTCFMPLFHCNALIFSHLSTFAAGGSVQLLPKFSASTIWDAVEDYRAHSFSCPPTVLAILLERTPKDRPTPQSLRFVKVGAAPLAENLASSFEQRFGVPIVEGYGMTEGTATTTMHDPRQPRPQGTVGHPLHGQRVRIVDELGQELPGTRVGQIQIGGDTVMLGYHRDEQATRETIIDGWLSTGDLGSLDEVGNLRLAGRQKELIIRGGENIFPAALDSVIESHPEVIEGAVYGIPDPIWGESPAAVIVRRRDDLDLDELSQYVRARVADFAAPVVYRVVDSIPRNAVGKVRRHELTRAHGEEAEVAMANRKDVR